MVDYQLIGSRVKQQREKQRLTQEAVAEKADSITGYVVKEDGLREFQVTLGELTDDEREIILKGCLINYNRK